MQKAQPSGWAFWCRWSGTDGVYKIFCGVLYVHVALAGFSITAENRVYFDMVCVYIHTQDHGQQSAQTVRAVQIGHRQLINGFVYLPVSKADLFFSSLQHALACGYLGLAFLQLGQFGGDRLATHAIRKGVDQIAYLFIQRSQFCIHGAALRGGALFYFVPVLYSHLNDPLCGFRLSQLVLDRFGHFMLQRSNAYALG